jgi:hypothetical protein
MLTYAVHRPDGVSAPGLRCVKVSWHSPDGSSAEFDWYGEGNWGGGPYRHIGTGYTNQGEFGSLAKAADMFGNGETFNGFFTNLVPAVTTGAWPAPQEVRITGPWNEIWRLVTTDLNYKPLPSPTVCGPHFASYTVTDLAGIRQGSGVRCVADFGYAGFYLWFGNGEWDGMRYSHIGNFNLSAGNKPGVGRASDLCDPHFGTACNDFPAASLTFTSIEDGYQVTGAWSELWKPGGRTPVLETIVQRYGDSLRIVPEAPDGTYTIGVPRRPTPHGPLQAHPYLRFRVQHDVNMKILVDGIELPRLAGATQDSGWYEPSGTVPESGSRSFFWDIAVELPPRVFAEGLTDFRVTLAPETFTQAKQPELGLTLRLRGRDPAYARSMPRPSDVFVDNTENTKPDNRMQTAIVARGVTLAGWLIEPHLNNGPYPEASGASEDWHFDIFLDPDFIERNYGSPVLIEPIKSASLPGNGRTLLEEFIDPATRIPLLSFDPALPTSKPTAATFTLPGHGSFVVELNAWHKWSDNRGSDGRAGRGPAPPGWISDPDPSYFWNAWPFDPRKGTRNATGSNLRAGDYIIVSGTLWQDSVHKSDPDLDARGLRQCFEDYGQFKSHGGWLEIHPVDAVRRVDQPSPRKHAVGLAACYPHRSHLSVSLTPPFPPPDSTSQLHYKVIVDGRFTSSNAVHTETVATNCEPPALNVTADLPSPGTFNATYILWWKKSEVSRAGRDICLSAIGPILGGAPD